MKPEIALEFKDVSIEIKVCMSFSINYYRYTLFIYC